jgi:hypothetical protein
MPARTQELRVSRTTLAPSILWGKKQKSTEFSARGNIEEEYVLFTNN